MKRRQYFANAAPEPRAEGFLFANAFSQDDQNWVQVSPFGDFWNVDKAGNKAIQRFGKPEAEAICNSFANPLMRVLQPYGIPWYVGHPDHPRFKGKPGHSDESAKGRGKELQVRHDANCKVCADFANSGIPCGEHGLFVRMKWNKEGEQLIANEAFHGHSVNWATLPGAMENGVRIWRPTRIKSIGFTNEPGIPVKPATMANALDDEDGNTNPNNDTAMIIPPWMKVLAGFKADEEVTEEQIKTALEKILADNKANANDDQAADHADFIKWLHEALGTKPEETTSAELKSKIEGHLANSKLVEKAKKSEQDLRDAFKKHDEAHGKLRQHMANIVADQAVAAGRVTIANRGTIVKKVEAAGEDFANVITEINAMPVVVKTTARTALLGGQNTELLANVQERQAKWDSLMKSREQEFANESYDARYGAVAQSAEGKAILAQMVQPTKSA